MIFSVLDVDMCATVVAQALLENKSRVAGGTVRGTASPPFDSIHLLHLYAASDFRAAVDRAISCRLRHWQVVFRHLQHPPPQLVNIETSGYQP